MTCTWLGGRPLSRPLFAGFLRPSPSSPLQILLSPTTHSQLSPPQSLLPSQASRRTSPCHHHACDFGTLYFAAVHSYHPHKCASVGRVMRAGQISSKRREIQGRPPVSCSRVPHGTPHVLDSQLLVYRHLGDGNANRANCVSGGAGLGSQKREHQHPLHHYQDRPPPRPIPRDGACPLPGTCVQVPTAEGALDKQLCRPALWLLPGLRE